MYTEHYNVETNGGIHFNETEMFVYHILKKQLHNDGPLIMNETTSRYLHIFFAQETIDWTKPYDQRYTSEKIPARACTADDFGYHPKQVEEYERWKDFSVVCPDLKPG